MRLNLSWQSLLTVVGLYAGDGRYDIKISEHKPSLAGLLANYQPRPSCPSGSAPDDTATPCVSPEDDDRFPLRLNIVIQVVGSRGDVQPFVTLGKTLKQQGHRVRLATHMIFKDFISEHGLEFFCIGGDPAELMSFMVRNSGIIPDLRTIRSGAIRRHRRDIRNILCGCWRSCWETGDGTQLHQIPDDLWNGTPDYRHRPFVADAIIANPPSFAHIHCAETLRVPLTLMFTFVLCPPACSIRSFRDLSFCR